MHIQFATVDFSYKIIQNTAQTQPNYGFKLSLKSIPIQYYRIRWLFSWDAFLVLLMYFLAGLNFM